MRIIFLFLITVVIMNRVSSEKYSISTRIAGGKPSVPGQFPYQAHLKIKFSYFQGGLCGGSLISVNRVLTAAHCIYAPKYILLPNEEIVQSQNKYSFAIEVHVSLGVCDLKNNNEYQQIHVQCQKNCIIHPAYSILWLTNDIAIIRLTEPAQLNQFVQPINLPSSHMEDFSAKNVIVSGWGVTSNESTTQSILRYVNLQIVPNNDDKCYTYGYTKLCASGSGEVGTCSGDSGGPLAYKNEFGTNYLIGITSTGAYRKCGGGSRCYFTRVSKYLDWITENMC